MEPLDLDKPIVLAVLSCDRELAVFGAPDLGDASTFAAGLRAVGRSGISIQWVNWRPEHGDLWLRDLKRRNGETPGEAYNALPTRLPAWDQSDGVDAACSACSEDWLLCPHPQENLI